MSYYKIRQPNGIDYKLYYEKETTFEEKKEILENTVLKHWEDYMLNDKWLYFGVFEIGKHNHEDKVKYMLERCADFLLQGELNYEGLWVGYKKQKTICALESPLECSDSMTQDLFYSLDSDEYSEYKKRLIGSNKNEEFYNDFIKPLVKEKPTKKVAEYKKQYRHKRNRIKKIESIIDFKKQYEVMWCSVDTQNRFKFNGFEFEIDGRVEAYQGEYISDGSVFYSQDKVLAYYQNGKYYFFDMGYNMINEVEKITEEKEY